MTNSPALLDALRRDIDSAQTVAELESVIAAAEGVKARAYAKLVMLAAQAQPVANGGEIARIESALAEIQTAVEREVLLTEHEVADMRHRSISALRKERERQAGPPWIKDGQRVLYPKRELAAWLAANLHETQDSQAHPRFRRPPT